MIFDNLIFRSSESTIIQNGKSIIQRNNKFIFIKYDYQILNQSINQLDVPFTNGEFNTVNAFMNMNVDDIECDESIVVNE